MKRILSFILSILILISAMPTFASSQEMRAVWFSYEDYASQLAHLSRAQYENAADRICKNIKSSGMNTLIFHVRAFSDAFYNSARFEYSRYVTGTAGVSPGYDPFAIMCDTAHRNGLNIHAWINPYRIGSTSNITESSVPYQWRQQYGDELVCEVNGLWYYNPASAHVRDFIVEGVREIVLNYPVEGIHFDDYFYPTNAESFDAASYASSGTNLTLNEWRLNNVNLLIKSAYNAIKSINPNILFGISPNANIEKNYTNHYADVRTWCREAGYIDYIVPQIYFGYENSTMPFTAVLNQWREICAVPSLYIGIAAYKAGTEDRWAGDGRWEWTTYNNVCARQIADIRNCPPCKGFMLFSYSSLWCDTAPASAKAELAAIESAMQASPNTQSDNTQTIKNSVINSFIAMMKAIFNIF